MSIGLSDLEKKRRPVAKKKGAAAPEKPSYPSGAWAARSKTARPWSDTGLSRTPNRKRITDPDAVMNEDWLSLHAAPLFWIDLSKHSWLAKAQKRLNRMEVYFQRQVRDPLLTLRRFLTNR